MAALTLVVGDEELLVGRAVSRALATAAASPPAGGEAVETPTRNDLAAGECTLDDLADVLSPSLFAEARLLVLRDLQDADKDLVAALVGFTEDAEPGVTIVVTHAGGAKGKAALEALKGVGAAVIDVPRIKTVRDREQFVIDEVRSAGATLDREAAADLVGSIGNDLRELASAAAQLAADVGGRISAEVVATYHRGRAESTGFAVADRAVEGDLGAALETLRWAFATGLDPILVSSSLAANLRLIVQVGAAGPGSPDSLAGPLKMPAWKIRRAQGWLRRWRSAAAIEVAVSAIAAADADLKGAGDDAAYAVERAVMAVAAAASAA